MPAPKVKHEGNGHRTRITNIKEIAQSLRVPPASISHFFLMIIIVQVLLKFIGYELACQLKLDEEIFKGFYSGTMILHCIDK